MLIIRIIKVCIILGVGILISCTSSNSELGYSSIGSKSSKNIKNTEHEVKKHNSKINLKIEEVFAEMKKNNSSLEQASKISGVVSSGDSLVIDIGFSNLTDLVIKEIEELGVKPLTISKKYNRMSASVTNLSVINELAKIAEVSIINPEYGLITH